MPPKINLEYDHLYHIFNRGNNRRRIFFENTNYHYFLNLYFKHIQPIARTFAYALLPDHFHFVVVMRSEKEVPSKYNSTARLSITNLLGKEIYSSYLKAGSKQFQYPVANFPKGIYFVRIQSGKDKTSRKWIKD